MAIHTVAFRETLTTTLQRRDVVPDTVVASNSNDAFILQRPMWLVAAYAGATGLTQARIVIADNPIAPSYIRPIDLSAEPASDPNLQVLDPPIRISAQTELAVEAVGSASEFNAVLWLADEIQPAPPGEPIWIDFSAQSQALTAMRWTALTDVAWGKSLPGGLYAVTGLEVWRDGLVSARLVFQDQVWRPGTLGQETVGGRTHRIFYDGSLGVMGTFAAYSPPSIELMCAAAAASVEGYLRVVRIA